MARIRTIKPEFWTDSKTGTLSDGATKVFIAMLNLADDFGVLRMDLAELKARIYPYSNEIYLSLIAPQLLDELLPRGLVQYFGYGPDDDEPMKPYLFIRNFSKHQKVDKPGKPLISGWDKGTTVENFASAKEFSTEQFDEHSTNPPRTFPEHSTNVRGGKGREEERKKTLENLSNAKAESKARAFGAAALRAGESDSPPLEATIPAEAEPVDEIGALMGKAFGTGQRPASPDWKTIHTKSGLHIECTKVQKFDD
jgi:hypothetical protein